MKDIYNTKVVSVGPETELGDIANIMSEQKVHTFPVVDDGEMVGVIGKLDLIRAML